MSKKLVIALDCMGGDRAPQIVIEGASLIVNGGCQASFLLFGDSKKILPILNRHPLLKSKSEVCHSDDFISADEKPSIALRRGTKSSMRLAIDAVKNGLADVAVSAGNTGALMAISKVILRPLQLIDRPAIITSMPNRKGGATTFLDMGANVECNAENLFQFAVMGRAFAKFALKIENPTIGILNIGSEESKGNDHVKAAADLIRASDIKDSFYGYIEGDEINAGVVDVIVTDGFTGNVALKAIEGAAKFISTTIKEGFSSSLLAKIGYLLASQSLEKVKKNLDPRLHNGAMLVGLNGVVVKSHGSTDSLGFSNAIKVAISLVENKINEQIIKELSS